MRLISHRGNIFGKNPGKQPILNSVAVLPEIHGDDISVCWGICSDIIGEYTK